MTALTRKKKCLLFFDALKNLRQKIIFYFALVFKFRFEEKSFVTVIQILFFFLSLSLSFSFFLTNLRRDRSITLDRKSVLDGEKDEETKKRDFVFWQENEGFFFFLYIRTRHKSWDELVKTLTDFLFKKKKKLDL